MNAPNHSNRFPDLKAATDRLFDRELSREDREALSAQLDTDPQALRAFRETTNALLELREPVDTPDVTAAVLARLDARPGFTTRRSRRIITTTRLAVAAALLGAGAGILLLQQYPTKAPIGIAQRNADADPIAAQLHDPELAAREIEALRENPFSTARPRGLAQAFAPLDSPPLVLDLSDTEIPLGSSGYMRFTEASALPANLPSLTPDWALASPLGGSWQLPSPLHSDSLSSWTGSLVDIKPLFEPTSIIVEAPDALRFAPEPLLLDFARVNQNPPESESTESGED